MSNGAWQREFLELLDTHGAMLMAMLRRLCGNHQDAEDVFQDTALRVWHAFASRPRLRNPKAWVLTIGYRAFLDARQRKKTHQSLPDPVDHRNGLPEHLAECAEESDRVQAAVAELPEAVREVVVLHYVAGLSIRQTANAMDLPEGTVKSRLNTAINHLRSLLG